jgi:hypothetical protein
MAFRVLCLAVAASDGMLFTEEEEEEGSPRG